MMALSCLNYHTSIGSEVVIILIVVAHTYEKSLRHVAMVAKFPDVKKPKTSLKKRIRTVSNFIEIIQCHLICQMLAKFSGVESQRPNLSLKKEGKNFSVVFTYFVKQAREIRKFHVAVLQRGLKNVQKRVMHVQSCNFANVNLLLFAVLFAVASPSSLLMFPIVVIQKFCYHGNMTSHFSLLPREQLSDHKRSL